MVTKAYKRLWNSFDDLLKYFGMKIMPNIDEAAPTKLRIVEIEEKRETRHKYVEKHT
jgi:hypothetical protein